MTSRTATRDRQILFIVSGPSGSGKDSVITCLLERVSDLQRIATYSTRPMRPGESEGRPYHFVTDQEFDRLRSEGEIFESETVYGTHRYGSPRRARDGGGPGDLVIELDPHGYRRLRAHRTAPTVGLFLLVPDLQELEARITRRYPEADVRERLRVASRQILEATDYDYILMNDELQRCCADAARVCEVERIRRRGRVLQASFSTP